jgi:hypothetical protein
LHERSEHDARPPEFGTVLLVLPLFLIFVSTGLSTLVTAEIVSGDAIWVKLQRMFGLTPMALLITVIVAMWALGNRAYIGQALHKGDSYPGEHDAIIDRATWDKVHAILLESPRKRAARTRAETPALLKGLIFGPDGAAFSPTHTRKGDRLYRYYVSQTVLKHGARSAPCPVGRVPAGEIEATVIDQLRAVFRQPEIVAGTWKAARAHAGDITEADARAALQQLDPLWDDLFLAEQARIVALLVERVDIGTEGLNLRLRIDGLHGLARDLDQRKDAA